MKPILAGIVLFQGFALQLIYVIELVGHQKEAPLWTIASGVWFLLGAYLYTND